MSSCADFGNNQILLFLCPCCSLGVHLGLVQGWAPRLDISPPAGSAHPCSCHLQLFARVRAKWENGVLSDSVALEENLGNLRLKENPLTFFTDVLGLPFKFFLGGEDC